MRKLILLLIIQYCGFTFGQSADNHLTNNTNSFKQHLISENCHNSVNWASNRKCIEREINSIIQQKFDFEITMNFEPGEYIIHSKFSIDLKGDISNVHIDSPNLTIKNELFRIFKLLPKTFRLVNENSEAIKGNYEFPTKIRILD